MPKPEMPEMVMIKSSSSLSFAQMNVLFLFFVVVVVQAEPDKPRDLVVLNLDWSTREWELREYFEVGVRFFGKNQYYIKIRTLENLPECRWVDQDGPTKFEALLTSDLLTSGPRRGWVR